MFLLSRVITTSAADTGLKTDAQSIADLLVDHLNTDTAALRGQVRTALDELVDADRKLDASRRAQPAALRNTACRPRRARTGLPTWAMKRSACATTPPRTSPSCARNSSASAADLVRRITIPQGTSKSAQGRLYRPHHGAQGGRRAVRMAAVRSRRHSGQGSRARRRPRGTGLLNRLRACGLSRQTHPGHGHRRARAATRTLAHFGSPKTPEGQEARNALLKQQGDASKRAAELLSDAVTSAQLFQGGGQAVDEGNTLDERLRKAATDGAARLFNRFAMADAIGWPQAYQDAAKGLVDALKKIGHETPAETHPVAQEILTHIGAGSLKGSKLRDRFMGSPYGWSNEAVNAALAVLFAVGQLRVTTLSGQPVTAGKFLERDVNQYDFARENTPLSLTDKRAVARLTKCKPDDAESQAPVWVASLGFLRAAGTAPRPAPTLPPLLDELDKLAGKDLVKRLATEEEATQQLALDLEAQEAQVAVREPRWNDLGDWWPIWMATTRQLHCRPSARPCSTAANCWPTPTPCCHWSIARPTPCAALNDAHAAYSSQFRTGVAALQGHADWCRLNPADQATILSQVGLAAAEPAPAIGTLDELLASLAQCTPARWRERHDAIAGKLQQARAACSKKSSPRSSPTPCRSASCAMKLSWTPGWPRCEKLRWPSCKWDRSNFDLPAIAVAPSNGEKPVFEFSVFMPALLGAALGGALALAAARSYWRRRFDGLRAEHQTSQAALAERHAQQLAAAQAVHAEEVVAAQRESVKSHQLDSQAALERLQLQHVETLQAAERAVPPWKPSAINNLPPCRHPTRLH